MQTRMSPTYPDMNYYVHLIGKTKENYQNLDDDTMLYECATLITTHFNFLGWLNMTK